MSFAFCPFPAEWAAGEGLSASARVGRGAAGTGRVTDVLCFGRVKRGGAVMGGGTGEDGRGGLKVVAGGKLGRPAAAGGEAGKTGAQDSKQLGQLRALDLLV